MVQRKQVRHLFFGSNTSRGFTSYFQETTTSTEWYTFVLKGGPGTGKSTFMQRTATDLLPLGAEIEYHYCSADPDSIDAITIPAIGVAIVDGTAPHIIEPVHYGVTGEIVNLSIFTNDACIRKHRSRIEALSETARKAFVRAYNLLTAARYVRLAGIGTNPSNESAGHLYDQMNQLSVEVFHPLGKGQKSKGLPTVFPRRLFVNAITPKGPRHHLESLIHGIARVFVLKGGSTTDRSALLQSVAECATDRAITVEMFHCAFDPLNLDHLVIPALHTAIISSVPFYEYESNNPVSIIRPDQGLNEFPTVIPNQTTVNSAGLEEPQPPPRAGATDTFGQLLHNAVQALQDARTAHLALEQCYVPYTDFDALENTRLQVRDKIVQRAQLVQRFTTSYQ